MSNQKQRSENFLRKQQEKIENRQVQEDQKAADFYETQNRLMLGHKKYYRIITGRRFLWVFRLRGYEKWLDKVWVPYMKKRQEEQIALAKAHAEGMKKAADLAPATVTNKGQ